MQGNVRYLGAIDEEAKKKTQFQTLFLLVPSNRSYISINLKFVDEFYTKNLKFWEQRLDQNENRFFSLDDKSVRHLQSKICNC